MSEKFNPIQSVQPDGMVIPEVGNWGEKKYKLVGHYCNIFTKSMKDKWNLVYMDLFAGAGYTRIRETGAILKSSALIALSVPNPFDLYLFNELDIEKLTALQKRTEILNPESRVITLNLDTNTGINEIISYIPSYSHGKSSLVFCFLDPYSLNLKFDTIRALAENRTDILMLLALQMDGKRNAKVYLKEENKRIEEFVENTNWRADFDNGNYSSSQFIKFLSDQFDKKMLELGYQINLDKVPIKTDSGLGLYYLAFYSKHNLGSKFFEAVKKYSDNQYSMF